METHRELCIYRQDNMREISHCWFNFLHVYKNWGSAKLKPGAKNSIWVSHMGGWGQEFEPSFAVSQEVLAGSYIGRRVSRTRTGTVTWHLIVWSRSLDLLWQIAIPVFILIEWFSASKNRQEKIRFNIHSPCSKVSCSKDQGNKFAEAALTQCVGFAVCLHVLNWSACQWLMDHFCGRSHYHFIHLLCHIIIQFPLVKVSVICLPILLLGSVQFAGYESRL